MRLRLDLSYDGTHFSGWAAQPGRRTVAGELAAALERLFRGAVPIVVAGRTDAGVHATGQVAHIDVPADVLDRLAPRRGAFPGNGGCAGLLRRLAGLLPGDVRVRRVARADPGFDARFAALCRHYRYRITQSPFGAEPLRRWDTLAWARPLDVPAMNSAGSMLLGLHDFAAYCRAPASVAASTIRALLRLVVAPVPGEPEVVAIDVSADAFCHSMVRSLVGALLAVGDGRTPADRPAELLRNRLRTPAAATAPAHGLTLIGVDYPDSAELAARSQQTRAIRQSTQ